jgi:hypothetical protein
VGISTDCIGSYKSNSFNIYLKVGWIKRLFSNLDGDWQKVLLFNLQSYGGERILTFQKEKLKV